MAESVDKDIDQEISEHLDIIEKHIALIDSLLRLRNSLIPNEALERILTRLIRKCLDNGNKA